MSPAVKVVARLPLEELTHPLVNRLRPGRSGGRAPIRTAAVRTSEHGPSVAVRRGLGPEVLGGTSSDPRWSPSAGEARRALSPSVS